MISKIFSSTSSVEDAAVSAHFDVSRVLRMLALFHLDSSRLCCVYCATQELKRPGLHKTFYVYYLPTHECQIIKREEEEEKKKKRKEKKRKKPWLNARHLVISKIELVALRAKKFMHFSSFCFFFFSFFFSLIFLFYFFFFLCCIVLVKLIFFTVV